MTRLRRYRHAIVVLAGALVMDVGIRFIAAFDMTIVVPAEAVLFGVAGAVLLVIAGRADAGEARARRLDLWVAACFLLACIRSGLWAGGVAVYVANVTVLALAVVLALVVLVRRHRSPKM